MIFFQKGAFLGMLNSKLFVSFDCALKLNISSEVKISYLAHFSKILVEVGLKKKMMENRGSV